MDKQPVGQLPDLTQSNNDDEIMVITNDEYNQLKKEKISDFITDLTSTDENNAIVKGTDGKMFVTDFGNASNITEGTLPVSVLPDIPKDKLPEIETDDLPDSGITAGTYTYPTDIVVNSKGQVTSITEGQAGANNANQDLSNLGPLGLDKINQSKALETGAVSSDADVYADVLKYAHSTFDLSKFEVVGSPNINNNGIFNNTNTNEKVNIQIPALGNNFIIECPIRHYGEKYTGGLNNLFSDSGINLRFAYGWGSTWYLDLKDTNGDIINGSSSNISYAYSTDKNYLLRLICEFKNDVYNIVYELYEEGILVKTLEITTDKKPYVSENSVELFIKESVTSTRIVDLKLLRIVSDVPVFNGNKTGTDTIDEIEIPYTLSKTGSKIVDAAYRDRVLDMYEQYGYAPYYTIDEENEDFTLPMGEIYGMIDNKANTSLDNITATGSNVILKTGYTKQVNSNLFSGIGMPTQRFFTLDFLPSDGGVYEVFISARFSTSKDGFSSLECGSTLQNLTAICATNNSFSTQGNALIVTNDRRIWLQNKETSGGVISQRVDCLWYRKIGLNQ